LPRGVVVRFFGQLPERDRILELLPLARVGRERKLESALLLRQLLRALLIVPEARLYALALDQLDARLFAFDVKAPPEAQRSASRALPVPEASSPCAPV
jgi:hypothetical protein